MPYVHFGVIVSFINFSPEKCTKMRMSEHLSLNSSVRASASVSAPAPTPFPEIVVVVHDIRLLGVLLSVIITTMLLLFLFFAGRVRRSVRGGVVFKYSTKISYLLVPISITYVMGQMHNDNQPHVWYPIWAGALIYAYGGVVTMTACDLRDNEDTLKYVWRTLPSVFYTVWLGLLVSTNKRFSPTWVCAVVFFLVLAAINARQTLLAFYKASRSKGMPRMVEPTVEYLTQGGDVAHGQVNPRSMKGYKYLVWGDPTSPRRGKMVITTEEVWKWVTSPPRQANLHGLTTKQKQEQEQEHQQEAFHPVTIIEDAKVEEEEEEETATSDQRHHVGRVKFLHKCTAKEYLRDLCLSHALFRMLLTRFAGFPILNESRNLRYTKQFILEGLLCSPEPQPEEVERVFHLIEVELNFLFDLFYTKSHVCSSYRFRDMLLHLAHIGLLWIFATIGVNLIVHSVGKEDLLFSIFKRHHLEVIVTRCVVILFVMLEFWKYVMSNYSNRKIVWLLCTAIRQSSVEDKWARVTEMRLIGIWELKYYLSRLDLFRLFSMPWQRKLGQYSFLDNYHKGMLLSHKLFSSLNVMVKLPRVGQGGYLSVPLSSQVKRAIVSSLIRTQLQVSRGANTLERHHLIDDIKCFLGDQVTDTWFILVWHIATSFCESLSPPQDADEHFLVATRLSKYCAYLLNFAPELLPGHPYTTERLFDKAVKQAHDHFHVKNLSMRERYRILIAYSNENDNNNNSNNNNKDDMIVVTGALLARALICGVIKNPNRGWRVLAEFWAELLLYLAPSDNVEGHAQYLAKGGEFITHLWTLLSHAGVFTTPTSPTS